MQTSQPRLEVLIDVFEEQEQRASIVAQLTVRELIESILQEFRSLAYLSDTPTDYVLVRAHDGSPLDEQVPLAQQIKSNERLVLVEGDVQLPAGTQRPSKHIYLRDDETATVYKLHWYPAIIGRSDNTIGLNDHVAVDLTYHARGLRVSRRHAEVIEEQGHFFIKSLSQNATTIIDAQGQKTLLTDAPVPLADGQSISLDQSEIMLKFIIRNEAGPV